MLNSVDRKEIKGLFFLLLWGEINNQHLVGVLWVCFPWARSAGMRHRPLSHGQHPSLWVGKSVLPGKKLRSYGCVWAPPKRHTKVLLLPALEVPNYSPLVLIYIKITCVFIRSFGMKQDDVWSYQLWLPVHCGGAAVRVLHSVLWEYVKSNNILITALKLVDALISIYHLTTVQSLIVEERNNQVK